MKPRSCKHCKKPVRVTIGGLGYCKTCLNKARERNQEEHANRYTRTARCSEEGTR